MSSSFASINVERTEFKDIINLMEDSPAKHLEEVPFGNFQLELDLCDEVYEYSESVGYIRGYTVWVHDECAGYMIVVASEMLHHKGQTQAITDSFYISPKFRSGGTFTKLMEYVEQDLAKEGIRFLTVGANPNMPNSEDFVQFLRDHEYITTEVSLTKELI